MPFACVLPALCHCVLWCGEAMAFDGVIVLLSVVDLVNDFASGSGWAFASLTNIL